MIARVHLSLCCNRRRITSFIGLPGGGNYTVTPTKAGYAFSTSLTYNNLSAPQTLAHFIGTSTNYSISGIILNHRNVGLSGVTVTLGGAQSATTTTGADGSYSFPGLPSGGNYTVTPSSPDYTFSPASRDYNNLTGNRPAADFSVLYYTISGHVENGQYNLSGVLVTVSDGQTGMTDQNGYYSFRLLPGGNYTVTPSLSGYTFSPASQTYGNLNADDLSANFSVVYAISGHVLDSGGGISGVTLTLVDSTMVERTAITDASGAYAFSNVTGLEEYTLTASKPGFTFMPENLFFIDGLQSDQTNADFTGTSNAVAPEVELVNSAAYDGVPRPQALVTYTTTFTNKGGAGAANLVINEPIPANCDFKVGSPTTTPGTSGLTASISYSDDGGSTWDYVPAGGAGGAPADYDRAVTHVRWIFAGLLAPSTNAPNNAGALSFTVRIR